MIKHSVLALQDHRVRSHALDVTVMRHPLDVVLCQIKLLDIQYFILSTRFFFSLVIEINRIIALDSKKAVCNSTDC